MVKAEAGMTAHAIRQRLVMMMNIFFMVTGCMVMEFKKSLDDRSNNNPLS